MRAVILGAGQGRRLLPLTQTVPKCLLSVGGRPILGWQLRGLAAVGIDEVTLVTGFADQRVAKALPGIVPPGMRVETLYNPFFAVSDNIGSCYLARERLLAAPSTLLLNGDTLFEAAVARRLLESPPAPVTVAIDRKPTYDADDMKVSLAGTRLRAIGKTLPAERTDGESIGMILFRDQGAALFVAGLETALREEGGLGRWYLSVINALAPTGAVRVASIAGHEWAEVDYPPDLVRAEALAAGWAAPALAAVE